MSATLFVGFSTVVGPMYLNEVSPLSLRGVSGTLNQLIIVLALTVGQTLGLPQLLGTRDLFYYILGKKLYPSLSLLPFIRSFIT